MAETVDCDERTQKPPDMNSPCKAIELTAVPINPTSRLLVPNTAVSVWTPSTSSSLSRFNQRNDEVYETGTSLLNLASSVESHCESPLKKRRIEISSTASSNQASPSLVNAPTTAHPIPKSPPVSNSKDLEDKASTPPSSPLPAFRSLFSPPTKSLKRNRMVVVIPPFPEGKCRADYSLFPHACFSRPANYGPKPKPRREQWPWVPASRPPKRKLEVGIEPRKLPRKESKRVNVPQSSNPREVIDLVTPPPQDRPPGVPDATTTPPPNDISPPQILNVDLVNLANLPDIPYSSLISSTKYLRQSSTAASRSSPPIPTDAQRKRVVWRQHTFYPKFQYPPNEHDILGLSAGPSIYLEDTDSEDGFMEQEPGSSVQIWEFVEDSFVPSPVVKKRKKRKSTKRPLEMMDRMLNREGIPSFARGVDPVLAVEPQSRPARGGENEIYRPSEKALGKRRDEAEDTMFPSPFPRIPSRASSLTLTSLNQDGAELSMAPPSSASSSSRAFLLGPLLSEAANDPTSPGNCFSSRPPEDSYNELPDRYGGSSFGVEDLWLNIGNETVNFGSNQTTREPTESFGTIDPSLLGVKDDMGGIPVQGGDDDGPPPTKGAGSSRSGNKNKDQTRGQSSSRLTSVGLSKGPRTIIVSRPGQRLPNREENAEAAASGSGWADRFGSEHRNGWEAGMGGKRRKKAVKNGKEKEASDIRSRRAYKTTTFRPANLPTSSTSSSKKVGKPSVKRRILKHGWFDEFTSLGLFKGFPIRKETEKAWCHHCRSLNSRPRMGCSVEGCTKWFCINCIEKHYTATTFHQDRKDFVCFRCRAECVCTICVIKKARKEKNTTREWSMELDDPSFAENATGELSMDFASPTVVSDGSGAALDPSRDGEPSRASTSETTAATLADVGHEGSKGRRRYFPSDIVHPELYVSVVYDFRLAVSGFAYVDGGTGGKAGEAPGKSLLVHSKENALVSSSVKKSAPLPKPISLLSPKASATKKRTFVGALQASWGISASSVRGKANEETVNASVGGRFRRPYVGKKKAEIFSRMRPVDNDTFFNDNLSSALTSLAESDLGTEAETEEWHDDTDMSVSGNKKTVDTALEDSGTVCLYEQDITRAILLGLGALDVSNGLGEPES